MNYLRKNPHIGFMLPGFILYLLFMIVPLITSIVYSFFDWNGFGAMKFIGFDNYIELMTDSRNFKILINAFSNNVKFVVIELVLIMPLQLLLSYMFYQGIKGYKILQMLVFLPYVISTVIVSFFTTIIFDPTIGIVNNFLNDIGLGHLIGAWYGDPNKSFILFMLTAAWQGIGVGMMIFLANLKQVPENVIEAGIIDGANARVRFFHIILPYLTPSLTNIIVLDTIWGLTLFDLPYIIGGPQGGVNGTLDFMNLFFYRNAFSGSYGGEASLGFAASISSLLFVIILLVSIVQVRILNKLRAYS